MNKKIFYLPVFMAVLALGSCDDYLDIKPKGYVIPEATVDYEKLLNYPQLMKAASSDPCFMTDDVFLPDEDPLAWFSSTELHLRRFYTFDAEVYGEGLYDITWEGSYNRIYTYNVIIADVLESTGSTEQYKKQIRAEALMGRAFEYLMLVNAYARHYDNAMADTDPGVPLMLDTDINKTDLQRATVQEVYDQVKADLDQAASDLPDKPVHNAFRASKPVGYGILARMYLYMGDYRKALENAEISLGHNSTLLDLTPYSVVDPDQWIGRIDVPYRGDNPENIYIRLAPYVYGLSGSVHGSEELVSLFDRDNDKRFLLYFTRYIDGNTTNYNLWAPYLYANLAMTTPEIYLIAAECEARTGSKDKAMAYINTLRDHRILNNTPLSAGSNAEALRLVLEERRRELTMLGCSRLIDLKRLNREPEFAKTVIHVVGGVKTKTEPSSSILYISESSDAFQI